MPAVSEPSLPHTWRPLGVRLAMIFFGGLLAVVCVAGWIAIGPDVRAKVTPYQQVTMVLIALLALALAWALVRCRVTATTQGLVVVNGYRQHAYEWAEVVAVHMPRGAPWATLDLADGTTASAVGIQSTDGERAEEAVRQLRLIVARTAAESLKRPDPPRD
jgi:hypothetical protein